MSKKPKKGAAKPSTVQPQSQAATQDLPDVGDALPSQDKTRAKKAKTKAATQAGSSSTTKAESSKAQPAPKKVGAAKATEASKKAATAKPTETPKKSGEGKKDAKRDKPRAVDATKTSGSGAKSDDAEKGRAKKDAGAKGAGAKGAAKGAGAKGAGAKGTRSEKSAQRTSSKARLESGEDDAAQLTFANSPFAESPHSDSPHADAKTSKRNQKLQKESDSQDQTSLKKPAGKRNKKRSASEPEARDVGATDDDIERQPALGATDESDEPRTEQTDNAAPDETLIDAAALAPEGEPTGDDEEAFEPSLFAAEGQAEDDDAEVLSEDEENRRYLKGILEALLFSSDKPLSGRELARAAKIDKKRTLQLLLELRKEYRHRGVNIAEISGGFVLRSNPTYGAYVQKALALRPVRLSRAQMETLAIIAYRQPITRPEIDDIRGVDSGQVLKGLADRDLIKMLGKKDEAGRPMLYGTTEAFLELFSLESLKGLPSLREFTELSDDSKEKFASVTGETMPTPASVDEQTEGSETLAGDAEPVASELASDAEATPSDAEPLDVEPSEVELSAVENYGQDDEVSPDASDEPESEDDEPEPESDGDEADEAEPESEDAEAKPESDGDEAEPESDGDEAEPESEDAEADEAEPESDSDEDDDSRLF